MPQQNEKNKLLDDSMQRVYQKVSKEFPDVKPVKVQPQGFMDKMLMNSDAAAITKPFSGNIVYNPGFMQQNPNTQEDIIRHELVHSRQVQNTPWYQTAMNIMSPKATPPPEYANQDPYHWQPREMEAFQTQREHSRLDPMTGHGDIELSAPRNRKIDTAPRMGSPLFQRKRGI